MKYHVRVGEREIVVELGGDAVRVDGREVVAELQHVEDTPMRRLVLEGRSSMLAVVGREDGAWLLLEGGSVHPVEAVDERTRHIRSLAGAGAGPARGGVVKAPMPGMVVRVAVAVGDTVRAGQGLVVLEAMKMENELKAPAAGTILELAAVAGTAVEKGAVLVRIGEP
jgi:pyruvate carboxylase subunit B